MAKRSLACGLEFSACPDLMGSLNLAIEEHKYDFVVIPIVHPGLNRQDAAVENLKTPFTRSCLTLDSSLWSSKVVGKVSSDLDVDALNPLVRKRSENLLEQELSYACHTNMPAVSIPLRSKNCVNLARIVSSLLAAQPHFHIWIEVPLENPAVAVNSQRSDVSETVEVESTWEWWNAFRLYCDSHIRLGVILSIGADLPVPRDRNRWLAEPVRSFVLPTSLFLCNRKGYPVLPQAHQSFFKAFAPLGTRIIVIGPNRAESKLIHYAQYMRFLWKSIPETADDDEISRGFEDYLQCPLQPLMNNLEAQTYETFEKDPVKYRVYQAAVYDALVDRVPEENIDDVNVVVMVMGAGRGPLVACVLTAANESGRNVKVYAVEKNPNAVNTLLCRKQEEWGNRVTVLAGDMRRLQLEDKADIIVSELLGSFGDNELSPECLDGAQKFLKDDGISIPERYTSYVCPVMSHKLFAEARACMVEPGKPQSASLETSYVVLQRNKQYLDHHQPLFTFQHPNRDVPIDNSRYASKNFTIEENSILHGFAGFFDTILYKDHLLSIVPDTFSTGMFSWFPIYMPVSRPVQLLAGNVITAHFWRRVGNNDVWYEWTISAPESLPIHNLNGRSCKIGL